MNIKKFSHDNFILILNHNFVLSNIFRRIFVIIGGNSKMLAVFISFRNFYVSKMEKDDYKRLIGIPADILSAFEFPNACKEKF